MILDLFLVIFNIYAADAEAQVRGQVQAGHAGADLAQAAAGQHDQAAPGGEAHLMTI